MKDGKKSEAKDLIKKAKEIPEKIDKVEAKAGKLHEQINSIMMSIPQIIHESVPLGKDDSENVELEKIGENKVPAYEVFNHGELAERLGGVDFDSSRKTSGQGFYFLKGALAELHSAAVKRHC